MGYNMSGTKKIVLAYSGGLDTSAIVPWLAEQGYTVHCVLVDVGHTGRLDIYGANWNNRSSTGGAIELWLNLGSQRE